MTALVVPMRMSREAELAGQQGPLVVFAGGGTGGHLYPALAIATAMRELVPDARFLFFCTGRTIDRKVLESAGEVLVSQPVRPIPVNPLRLPSFLTAWRDSKRICSNHFCACRPAVVVGTGGFASGPAVCVASGMGIPTALVNIDAVPGRANKYLSRRVDSVFVQWAESLDHFAGCVNVEVVGCPIRKSFIGAARFNSYDYFQLDPLRKTLLVTGASLGAHSLNLAMVQNAHMLSRFSDWQILHLTGEADFHEIQRGYAAVGLKSKCLAYTEMMPEAMAVADLIVSRSGASTLAEITAMGKPAVLVPYPHHRDMHQLDNARVLASREAAIVCQEGANAEETASRLGVALAELMGSQPVIDRMSAASSRLGVTSASGLIAEKLRESVVTETAR